MKRIEVVAAVIEAGREVLCVQRGPNPRAYISGKWEFPGGKVESDESHSAALVRELEEELRVRVVVHERLVTVEHGYPDFEICMHAYRCKIEGPASAILLAEHVEARWLAPADAAFLELDWAEADVPIVRLLRLRAGGE